MEVVLVNNHGDQFISQHGGDHKPRYGDDHVPGEGENDWEDAGVPGFRRLSHFRSDCGHFAVDIVKHIRQVAGDSPDQEIPDPLLNGVDDTLHRPLPSP